MELEIKDDHALRSADSYVFHIGEIMSQKEQGDIEVGNGDLGLECVFEWYHSFVLHTN